MIWDQESINRMFARLYTLGSLEMSLGWQIHGLLRRYCA